MQAADVIVAGFVIIPSLQQTNSRDEWRHGKPMFLCTSADKGGIATARYGWKRVQPHRK